MKILRASHARFTDEYGCLFRRLFNKDSIPDLNWGSGWTKIKQGTQTTPHQHDMQEVFFVTKGKGEVIVGNEHTNISEGDVLYIEANNEHSIKNPYPEILEVLCIWWPI